MNPSWFKLKTVLYAAALLLALVIRLAGANRAVSTDAEAALALQAWALAAGQEVILLPHPAYLALTVPLMFLFGALDWAARFWPVIAGSLLVLAPVLFQRWIGPLPAVLLAFLIAIDPGMVAGSLQVGGFSFALLFVALAAGFWLSGRPAWAGIAAGLALLSGPALWPGLISLLIAVLLAGWLAAPVPDSAGLKDPTARRVMLISGLVTLFTAGTLFFFMPRGLSAAAGSLPDYLSGWVEPGQTPALRMLLGLALYAFFPLILGLYGAVTGWLRREWADQFLSIWFITAFVLALVYPDRQVSSLVWALLPLLALAARQLARLLVVPAYDRLATLGQAVLVTLILGFISITLVALANRIILGSPQEFSFRLAGALVLLVASTGLIAWGWSRQVALRGFAWGAVLILLVYTISATWNVAGYAGRPAQELWSGTRQLPEARLLKQTIDLTTQWAGAQSGRPELVILGLDSPVLGWALRDIPNVQHAAFLSPERMPGLVISGDTPEVSFGAAYRGQGFTLTESTNWASMQPLDWLRWVVARSGQATAQEQIILWVRTDLFPGDEIAGQPEPVDEPDSSESQSVSPR